MGQSTDELHWRETYFILFPQDRRPKLDEVATKLSEANKRFQIENPAADEQGMIQSILVESDEDHAAVEISYEVGEGVIEQNLAWAKELQAQLTDEQIQDILRSDARLDVAHFERIPAGGAESAEAEAPMRGDFSEEFEEEEAFNMLDPTCLLTVVDALAELTGGLTFDPASGEILS